MKILEAALIEAMHTGDFILHEYLKRSFQTNVPAKNSANEFNAGERISTETHQQNGV